MGITVYSVVISIIFYNLALAVVFVLRRSPGFRAKHTSALLLFITLLGVLRLVIPLDLNSAHVIRSYHVIPALEDFLKRQLTGTLTPGHLLLLVWAIGTVTTFARDFHIQESFERELLQLDFVEKPELLEIAAELGSRYGVLVSPQLRMPFTTGLVRPVIYLPDVELSREEWRMVFRHELSHIHSHDNLKKLFFLAVEAVFWWNPLAHFSRAEINTLIELRCDAKVTADMDNQERLGYAALLKKLLDFSMPAKTPASVSNFIGGTEEMRLRFEALTRATSSNRGLIRYILPVMLSTVFVLSYFVIIQPIRMADEEEITNYREGHIAYSQGNDVGMAGSMYIVFENGSYRFYVNGEYVSDVIESELDDPPLNSIPILGGK